MGEVYEVERLVDRRHFAAKIITGRAQPEALERFTREAEAATRVNHPHVVRMHDVDVTTEGDLFLIMELVTGGSLDAARARYGDRSFAASVLPQIASALAAIHDAGIIHRDLKPANVLLEGGTVPVVKVADFGIAGMLGDVTRVASSDQQVALDATMGSPSSASPKLTRTGAIMGTPLYMAPEIFLGTGTTRAVDLFSFGLVAYQVLGGSAVVRKGMTLDRAQLQSFSMLAPWLPVAVQQQLAGCLDDDPASRPSARELADRLARL